MRRGFTLIEVIAATGVLVVGLMVIIGSYSMTLRQATQTQERQLALVLAQNMLEELQAHPYGISKPKRWGSREDPARVEFFVVLDGRRMEAVFHTWVETASDGNGSFFRDRKESRDRVEVFVGWREPEGDQKWKDQNLQFETTVWRQSDTYR